MDNRKKGNSSQELVFAAMLSALACVATMVIKIPSPLHGYINLGDCVVLFAGWTLSPLYAFLAAGIGSALADVFSGYVAYAPATFLIKGVMAIVAGCLHSKISSGKNNRAALAVSGLAAEVIMVVGYLAFESVLYGFAPSLANVLPNCVQGGAGVVIGTVLISSFKNKIR